MSPPPPCSESTQTGRWVRNTKCQLCFLCSFQNKDLHQSIASASFGVERLVLRKALAPCLGKYLVCSLSVGNSTDLGDGGGEGVPFSISWLLPTFSFDSRLDPGSVLVGVEVDHRNHAGVFGLTCLEIQPVSKTYCARAACSFKLRVKPLSKSIMEWLGRDWWLA